MPALRVHNYTVDGSYIKLNIFPSSSMASGCNFAVRGSVKFVGSNPATPTVKRGRNWPNEKGFNGGTPNVGGLCAR